MSDNIYASVKVASGQSGDLLKPEIGKPYKFRVIGEAVVYESEFNDPVKGISVSTNYVMAVWNFTSNQANIWRLPAGAFQQIVDLANSEWNDPTTFNMVYKKTGTGLETRHSVQPSAGKEEPTAEQASSVEAIDLKAVIEKFPSTSHVFYISEANKEAPPAAVTDAFEGIDVL